MDSRLILNGIWLISDQNSDQESDLDEQIRADSAIWPEELGPHKTVWLVQIKISAYNKIIVKLCRNKRVLCLAYKINYTSTGCSFVSPLRESWHFWFIFDKTPFRSYSAPYFLSKQSWEKEPTDLTIVPLYYRCFCLPSISFTRSSSRAGLSLRFVFLTSDTAISSFSNNVSIKVSAYWYTSRALRLKRLTPLTYVYSCWCIS